MTASKPETVLAARCKKALSQLGVVMVRVQSGRVRVGDRFVYLAEAGTPDFVLLFPGGVTRWLELKVGKNKLSVEQRAWRIRAERLGHVVDVAYSVEEVIAIARDALGGGNGQH